MRAGDRLVAVAGESVEGLCHEETVSRIRAQGTCVSLVVVDREADSFFKMVRMLRTGTGVGKAMEPNSGATGVLALVLQVRLSPLLFLESTGAVTSPPNAHVAVPIESLNAQSEDTAEPRLPLGSCQCSLYPGPGGGYGFRLCLVASGPFLIISQASEALRILDLFCHFLLDLYSSTSLSEPQSTQQTSPWLSLIWVPLPPQQVTPGGSAARAGLQRGDLVLEVNGESVGGDGAQERLQRLAEAKPPLSLKLWRGLEAWVPPGSGEVRRKGQVSLEAAAGQGQRGARKGQSWGGLQGETSSHEGGQEAPRDKCPFWLSQGGSGKRNV